MPNASRLFFALWPDAETRAGIGALGRHPAFSGGSRVKPADYHVTLAFLGQVETGRASALAEQAGRIQSPPFVIAFDGVDYWRKPKVACLTARQRPSEAAFLAGQLAAIACANGLEIDDRPFCPHVTLARKSPAFSPFAVDPLFWRADGFCLLESTPSEEGGRYRVKAAWPLDGAAFRAGPSAG